MDRGFVYGPVSTACGPPEGRYLMICRENDSGNKSMMGKISVQDRELEAVL